MSEKKEGYFDNIPPVSMDITGYTFLGGMTVCLCAGVVTGGKIGFDFASRGVNEDKRDNLQVSGQLNSCASIVLKETGDPAMPLTIDAEELKVSPKLVKACDIAGVVKGDSVLVKSSKSEAVANLKTVSVTLKSRDDILRLSRKYKDASRSLGIVDRVGGTLTGASLGIIGGVFFGLLTFTSMYGTLPEENLDSDEI